MTTPVYDVHKSIVSIPTASDRVNALSRALAERSAARTAVERSLSGTAVSAFTADRMRMAKLSSLVLVRANWLPLVLATVVERLNIDGFRTGTERAYSDDLWSLFESNGLSEVLPLVFRDALAYGQAFLCVWGDGAGRPVITAESPFEVAVDVDPASRAIRAAVKRWFDPADNRVHVVLFEPDQITRLRSVREVTADLVEPALVGDLVTVSVDRNPLGVVPIVMIENRDSLTGPSVSEIEPLIPLQEAITKLHVDLICAAEWYGQPRRWIVGAEAPLDPETGEPVSPLEGKSGDQLLVIESDTAKVGQWEAAPLKALTDSIRQCTEELLAIAQIPPHLSLGQHQGQAVSSDSIRAAEAALLSKVGRKMTSFSGPVEHAMRLALLVRDGRLPAGSERVECVWRDPATVTLGASADAAQKLAAIEGVSVAAVLESVMGWSPAQVQAALAVHKIPAPTPGLAQPAVGAVSSESLRLAAAAHTEGVPHV